MDKYDTEITYEKTPEAIKITIGEKHYITQL